MSRTHTVERNTVSTELFSSNTHEMQTAVERAMQAGNVVDNHGVLVTSFHFDLVDFVKSIKVERLHNDVLSRLQYSVDGYITGALSRILNQMYQHSKTDDTAIGYASYGEFLHHIESFNHTEQCIYEAGCDVRPEVERIHTLFGLRAEFNAIAASKLRDPTTYVELDLHASLLNPRVRSLSAADEQNLAMICQDDTDDIELRKELLEQYKLQSKLEHLNQHRLDRSKGEALSMLLSCIKADRTTFADVNDEDDAFYSLDARTQFGLLNTVMRCIVETRRKAVIDNRLPVMEKAALRVEAKALIAPLTVALEHSVFSDIDNR